MVEQNTSHAVMSQRHEPNDSLDYFPTPLWATRALCEELLLSRSYYPPNTVWEPACGEGHMSRALAEYFPNVISTDIHDYGYGDVEDFLFFTDRRADWIITNPPFKLAEQFVTTALGRATRGVAIFVRTAFLEGVGRYARLFSVHSPAYVYQFTERVPIHKGKVVRDGSTATAYCWIVWLKDNSLCGETKFRWISPCRKILEKDSDYTETNSN